MAKSLWDMTKLSKVPHYSDASEQLKCGEKVFYTEGDIKGRKSPKTYGLLPISYESEKYQGKPTRVFAWLGIPEQTTSKKLPGIVLVHGGGGTAFAHWVKMWNKRGYAAIAMDTCGNLPCGEKSGQWQISDYGGPDGCGDFENIDLPLKQQWTYHAVAAVIRAHSLLASFPQVDSRKIALCGLSWGGYLTCITMGNDHRFKCAVSIYGCGSLEEESPWLEQLNELGEKRKAKWLKNWDPCLYLPNAKVPTLWVTGSNDVNYTMKMLHTSYASHGGKPSLSVKLRYGHSHTCGWKRSETFAFVDSYCKGTDSLIRVNDCGYADGVLYASYSGQATPKTAWLCYATDNGKWAKRYWKKQKAIIENGVVTSSIPSKMTASFFNLIDDNNYTSSSPLIFPE